MSKWTKETPKESGWFWVRDEMPSPRVVQILECSVGQTSGHAALVLGEPILLVWDPNRIGVQLEDYKAEWQRLEGPDA